MEIPDWAMPRWAAWARGMAWQIGPVDGSIGWFLMPKTFPAVSLAVFLWPVVEPNCPRDGEKEAGG